MTIITQPLKIRSRLVASHQIPVISTDLELFQEALNDTITQAPALFQQAPVILDISLLNQVDAEELQALVKLCRTRQLIPYAVTSHNISHKSLAEQLNLAWVDFRQTSSARAKVQTPLNTKIITTPVRSGQQIYAKEANLIIMNLVSAGAEVIADGYVHVFGPLRGKAIAGANGNKNAEIVCQKMSAELVSIAGTYLIQENFPEGEGGAHCNLENDKIIIQYL